MKKKYQKPAMQVVELHQCASLLAGSPNPYGGDLGYIPGIGQDTEEYNAKA